MSINKYQSTPNNVGFVPTDKHYFFKSLSNEILKAKWIWTLPNFNSKDMFNSSEWICQLWLILPMLSLVLKHQDHW